MEAYIIKYENGVMIVTHSSGVIDRYSIAQLQGHKFRIEDDIGILHGECIAIDNRITLALESVNGGKET